MRRGRSSLLPDLVGDLHHLVLILDRAAVHLVASLRVDQGHHRLAEVDVRRLQVALLERPSRRPPGAGRCSRWSGELVVAERLQARRVGDVDERDLADRRLADLDRAVRRDPETWSRSVPAGMRSGGTRRSPEEVDDVARLASVVKSPERVSARLPSERRTWKKPGPLIARASGSAGLLERALGVVSAGIHDRRRRRRPACPARCCRSDRGSRSAPACSRWCSGSPGRWRACPSVSAVPAFRWRPSRVRSALVPSRGNLGAGSRLSGFSRSASAVQSSRCDPRYVRPPLSAALSSS